MEQISFSWTSPEGVEVVKNFLFSPESYMIRLNVTIKNNSDRTIKDNLTLSLARVFLEKRSRFGFEGPSALINDELEQIKLKKIKDKNVPSGKIKWISIQDRYFISAIIPEETMEANWNLYYGENNILQNEYVQPVSMINPGALHVYKYRLFFGPKSMKILKEIGYDLGEAVNFGYFDFLAKPFVWVMNFLYEHFIANYGVAIIILTLLSKIILWPLGNKSYKSMNEMKKIQPLVTEIREKYKDDKKKMNEEMMRLYKTYKVNPMGGCLPMVVQIPVFFALYRMLYETIELRHAPFFLWINDLSAPDRLLQFDFSIPFMQPPYGIPVLTIVMGATMFLQQKMSPPMGDPAQAKMMMLMPIVFTFVFINFSSGLVLYWLVNNILSIAQQYYISKKKA
jgi:YidC/Oxa1 family membrane protein insertase